MKTIFVVIRKASFFLEKIISWLNIQLQYFVHPYKNCIFLYVRVNNSLKGILPYFDRQMLLLFVKYLLDNDIINILMEQFY